MSKRHSHGNSLEGVSDFDNRFKSAAQETFVYVYKSLFACFQHMVSGSHGYEVLGEHWEVLSCFQFGFR